MDFICNDINGGTKWYFSPVDATYCRYLSGGKLVAQIKGHDLADPALMTNPQASTVKLWNHWQAHKPA